MVDQIPAEISDKKKKRGEAFYGYKIFVNKVISKHISIYLSDGIGDGPEFIDMIHKIRSANENDIITIHLNTPGGYLETGMQIINAIRATDAHVITSLESRAYSLGTLIFLSGDELQIHENCLMMFHHYSNLMYGKGHEITAELEMINKWFNKILKKICVPFLSEEEVIEIQGGRDIWMDSDEIRKRLNKMTQEEQIERKPAKKKKKPR